MNHTNLGLIIDDLQVALCDRLREEDIVEWRLWVESHLRMLGCLDDDKIAGVMTDDDRKRFIDEYQLMDIAIAHANQFELKEDLG